MTTLLRSEMDNEFLMLNNKNNENAHVLGWVIPVFHSYNNKMNTIYII